MEVIIPQTIHPILSILHPHPRQSDHHLIDHQFPEDRRYTCIGEEKGGMYEFERVGWGGIAFIQYDQVLKFTSYVLH